MSDASRISRWPLGLGLTSVVMGLAIVIALTVGRGGDTGNEVDTSRISRADRDQLLAAQVKATPVSDRCLDSLLTVEQAGLELRDQTEFRCPGTAAEPGEEHHWGATCWENELCPGSSYIAIDADLIGPDDAVLRYVIAHEICHVNSYMSSGDRGSETWADECAAGAGFPKP